MNKNDVIELLITSYNSEAQGVGRHEGMVVFVPFALVGEFVQVTIIKVTKNYMVGKVIKILKPSKERVEPKCSYYNKCGGCALQHASYFESLRVKEEIVRSALTRIGGFTDINVNPTIGCDNQYEYRNKSAFPVVAGPDGRLQLAMYRVLSHDPVFINSCPITKKIMINAANTFINYANESFIGEKTQIRHIVMRFVDKKLLFVVVTMKRLTLDGLFDRLCDSTGLTKDDVGLFECIKSVDNNVILEGKMVHVAGIESILSSNLGIDFSISPNSFYQVNDEIMRKIYQKAASEFGKDDVVIDAYSGAGLLSALLSKKVKKVIGIEIVKEATADANKVKQANHISNLENINGDVKSVLPNVVKKLDHFSLVIDPPRKGVDAEVLKAIGEAGPSKIVYISCNPASLSRDLKVLSQYGYKASFVQPYDMFPETQHVETLAVLIRK